MGRAAVVAGTGFEGRAEIIRRYCRENMEVVLRREPGNVHDQNAIAVYIPAPRLWGLLGSSLRRIGFIKSSVAKSLAPKMDSGLVVSGCVNSFYAPPGFDSPRVSLWLES